MDFCDFHFKKRSDACRRGSMGTLLSGAARIPLKRCRLSSRWRTFVDHFDPFQPCEERPDIFCLRRNALTKRHGHVSWAGFCNNRPAAGVRSKTDLRAQWSQHSLKSKEARVANMKARRQRSNPSLRQKSSGDDGHWGQNVCFNHVRHRRRLPDCTTILTWKRAP